MAYGLGTHAEDTPHTSGDAGVMALAVRQDDDTPSLGDDGDYMPLMVNTEGRLKVTVKPALPDLITGTINALGGTSLEVAPNQAGTLQADVSRCSNVMVQMLSVATTLSNYSIQFEGSLNSTNGLNGTWVILQAIRSNANTVDISSGALTTAAGSALNYSWELSVNAYNWFRIKTIAYTAGSAVWGIQRGTYATEPIPGVQTTGTQAISGTVTASNTSGATAHSAATSGNPVFVGGTVIAATIDTSLVQNDRAQLPITSGQQVITKSYAPSEVTFQYATPVATPVTTTTAVALRAAGAASIRNHLTNIQLINTNAQAGAVSVQDGTTVIWSTWLPASMVAPVSFQFDIPLRGTAATAMNFVANTGGMSIYVSAQGYQGF
jgi:hypothetical protein